MLLEEIKIKINDLEQTLPLHNGENCHYWKDEILTVLRGNNFYFELLESPLKSVQEKHAQAYLDEQRRVDEDDIDYFHLESLELNSPKATKAQKELAKSQDLAKATQDLLTYLRKPEVRFKTKEQILKIEDKIEAASQKLMLILRNTLNPSIKQLAAGTESPCQLWAFLLSLQPTNAIAYAKNNRKEFNNTVKGEMSITDLKAHLEKLQRSAKSYGEIISDEMVYQQILDSLPDDVEDYRFAKLILLKSPPQEGFAALLEYELAVKNKSDSKNPFKPSAFATTPKEANYSKFHCKLHGFNQSHDDANCKGIQSINPNGKIDYRMKTEWEKANEGSWESKKPANATRPPWIRSQQNYGNSPTKQETKNSNSKAGSGAYALFCKQNPTATISEQMAFMSLIQNKGMSAYTVPYIFDTGTTPNHLTPEKGLVFAALEPQIEITTAGAYPIFATGITTINIQTDNGSQLQLNNAYYVPSLEYGLISGAKLRDENYEVNLENSANFFKEGTLIATIDFREQHKLWITHDSPKLNLNTAIARQYRKTHEKPSIELCELWHKRFMFTNYQSLQTMIKEDMVKNFPLKSIQNISCKCTGCMLGKAHKVTFPQLDHPQRDTFLPGESIMCDLTGKSRVATPEGYLYAAVYTCNKTRYSICKLLQKKSQQKFAFIEVLAYLEKQTGNKLKHIHFDLGGEFVDGAFNDYLTNLGINITWAPARHKEHNAVAERKNRTHWEKTIAALYDSNVHKQYWGEFFKSAVYITNRVYTRANSNFQTPFEAFHKYKPSVLHLKRLGCLAWVFLEKEKREGKLAQKAYPCTFLGYSSNASAYRFAEIHSGKIIETIHAVFDEEKTALDLKQTPIKPFKTVNESNITTFEDFENSFYYKEKITTATPITKTSNRFNILEGDIEDPSDLNWTLESLSDYDNNSIQEENLSEADNNNTRNIQDDILEPLDLLPTTTEAPNVHQTLIPKFIPQEPLTTIQYSDKEYEIGKTYHTPGWGKWKIDEEVTPKSYNNPPKNATRRPKLPEIAEQIETESEDLIYLENVHNITTSDEDIDFIRMAEALDPIHILNRIESPTPIEIEIINTPELVDEQAPLNLVPSELSNSDEDNTFEKKEKQRALITAILKIAKTKENISSTKAICLVTGKMMNKDMSSYEMEDFSVKGDEKDNSDIYPETIIKEDEQIDSMDVPITWKQMEASKYKRRWMAAIRSELASLDGKATFAELEKKLDNILALGNKWVFSFKMKDGKAYKFKARLVLQGYRQRPGIDFQHSASPVVKMQALFTILILAALHDLEIHGMDVDTAYLNAFFKETVITKLPQGYEPKNPLTKFLLVQKALYGAAQSGRAWYECLTEFLKSCGYKQLKSDTCVFILYKDLKIEKEYENTKLTPLGTEKHKDTERLYVCIYVDDLLVVGTPNAVATFKTTMKNRFKMKDHGPIQEHLGLEFHRNRKKKSLLVTQVHYLNNMLEKYNIKKRNLKPRDTPASTGPDADLAIRDLLPADQKELDYIKTEHSLSVYVGSLQHITTTRPEIKGALVPIQTHVHKPRKIHFDAVMNIFSYLQTHPHRGVYLGGIENLSNLDLTTSSTSDANWAACRDTRRSILSSTTHVNNSLVNTRTNMAPTVALSSLESETQSSTEAAKDLIWQRQFLNELGFPQDLPSILQSDNMGNIFNSENDILSKQSRHFDLRRFWLRDLVHSRQLKLSHLPTNDMPSDIFTKSLPVKQFNKLRLQLGILSVDEFNAQDSRGGVGDLMTPTR